MRQRLPAPLHRHGGQIRQVRPDQRPTEEHTRVRMPDNDVDMFTLEPDDGPSPHVRRALAEHRRHLRRMDHIREARALAWFMFAVVCLLAVSVVSALVIGSMLGQWDIPVAPP